MTDTHTWLHHPETGGYWQCPVGAVEIWTSRGWQPCEAPPEVNLATAHWPAPAAPEAAPAAKKSKPVTPPPGENEEKIDG